MKKIQNNEPDVNTLVRHKKLKTLGIGCIAKVHPKHYTVNWGQEDTSKHLKSVVEVVDVSKCRTVPFQKFRNRIMMADPTTKNLDDVILGNVVKHFVGIGWVNQRVVTEKDLLSIPRVV